MVLQGGEKTEDGSIVTLRGLATLNPKKKNVQNSSGIACSAVSSEVIAVKLLERFLVKFRIKILKQLYKWGQCHLKSDLLFGHTFKLYQPCPWVFLLFGR